MASSKGAAGSRRLAAVLVLAAVAGLMASCTLSVPLSPTLDLPPAGARLPLRVGVYYSPEFRAYEAVELVGLHGDTRFVRPLGQATVSVFDMALSRLFETVVPVASRPPLAADGPGVAAVIEPRIEAANFGPPLRGVGLGPAVWAEITYGITMYTPKGDLIGSWKVRGMGEAETQRFRELQVLGRATDRAIQDAVTKFVKNFRNVPEVQRWLREFGVRGVGREKAD